MNIQYDEMGFPTPVGLPARLTIDEASVVTGRAVKTMQKMAHYADGPPCYRDGKRLYWPTAPLCAWMKKSVRWRVEPEGDDFPINAS